MKANIRYRTKQGVMIQGATEDTLSSPLLRRYKGKVQLIFTSPPFPLNTKKKYGNLTGREYVKWLGSFAPLFRDFLTKDGSIVIELGNAWESGRPIMSTLALEALINFLDSGNLLLCQQFIAYNKARLPSPAQWVNIERIRVKDAYTNVWWMSPVDRPKADNTRVLKEYSKSMKRLLSTGKYNPGMRPSEHNIGATSFLTKNKGAIPSNVLIFSNTASNDSYMNKCREKGYMPHPARMPKEIAEFFINFLTEPGDIVLDPFAGSNTTGWIAETLGRKWISIEKKATYAKQSRIRFVKNDKSFSKKVKAKRQSRHNRGKR
jgi:site-specific DNA-methyltransferase (cytosine-N4-specific)